MNIFHHSRVRARAALVAAFTHLLTTMPVQAQSTRVRAERFDTTDRNHPPPTVGLGDYGLRQFSVLSPGLDDEGKTALRNAIGQLENDLEPRQPEAHEGYLRTAIGGALYGGLYGGLAGLVASFPYFLAAAAPPILPIALLGAAVGAVTMVAIRYFAERRRVADFYRTVSSIRTASEHRLQAGDGSPGSGDSGVARGPGAAQGAADLPSELATSARNSTPDIDPLMIGGRQQRSGGATAVQEDSIGWDDLPTVSRSR